MNVCLFSGGLDSLLLYHYLKQEDYPVHCYLVFNFGQENGEVIRAAVLAEKHGFFREMRKIKLPSMLKSSGYVEGRNQILFSVAANIAFNGSIFTALHAPSTYADTSTDFVNNFNSLLASQGRDCRVIAPFIDLRLSQMVSSVGEDKLDRVQSCNARLGINCGLCDKCKKIIDEIGIASFNKLNGE